MTGGGAGRLIAVLAVVVLGLGAGAIVLRSGGDRDPSPSGTATTPSPTGGPSPSMSPQDGAPSDAATPDVEEAQRLLGSVEAAATAEPGALLEAGVTVGRGPWRALGTPAWPMREERPVYVGAVTIDGATITADVVIAHRIEERSDALVLRLLPAAVGDNGLEVTVRVDGAPVTATPEPGGLLRIELPGPYDEGRALAARIQLSYEVLTTAAAPDDSGPAAYGILAVSPGVTALGHWLPVLTFEPEPIVPWGDVGSFPPAVWSLRIEHEGSLVTGGSEEPCPDGPDDPSGPGAVTCTWSRGLALRDLSAVLFEEATIVESVASGMRVRAVGATSLGETDLETSVQEAVGSAESFTARFGPVAWRELDVVAVPLGQGAAGMEFPGLVMIDDELYDGFRGGFGTYVVAHEVAHQWFHALVGHGSFADPVVDESLAQYLSVLAYRDQFGPGAAQRLVDESMVARYRRFRESGLPEEPPAQHSADFRGPATYGPLVYARAPLGWLAAEDAIGEEGVVRFLAALVDAYGLGVLSVEDLLADAALVSEQLVSVLERYWLSDEPVPVP